MARRAIVLLAAFMALLAPSGAAAATVVNGDFESGTLQGWHAHRAIGAGNWFAYKGTEAPIKSSRRNAAPVQAPPQGTFAAITDDVNPDTLILYQDLALEPGVAHRLSFLAYYNSYKPIAVPSPETLSVDEEVLAGRRNQQFRIDVMKPSAPLESVDPADILLTVFATKPGDPKAMPPTRFTADLTPFAGQTVRLRMANAVHEEVFNAGVDAVALAGPADSSSRRFSIRRARVNRRRGTATLFVRVPAPGRLTARGKGIGKATARARAAGTVRLHLAPTRPGRAILEQRHKLRVMVKVTYAPTGGAPEAASRAVVLRLA